MKVTDEMLMALADGELDGETAAELRRRIAADPSLAADYEIFAQSARLLRQSAQTGPVPAHLIRAIRAAEVQTQAQQSPRGVLRFRPVRLVQFGAIAASVVLAFVAGLSLSPVAPQSQDFAADLLTGESRGAGAGGVIRVLASYETEQGLCRTLERQDRGRLTRDIICRQETDQDWKVALSLSMSETDGYIPASDTMSEALDSFLDQIGAGAPLLPEAEKARLGG